MSVWAWKFLLKSEILFFWNNVEKTAQKISKTSGCHLPLHFLQHLRPQNDSVVNFKDTQVLYLGWFYGQPSLPMHFSSLFVCLFAIVLKFLFYTNFALVYCCRLEGKKIFSTDVVIVGNNKIVETKFHFCCFIKVIYPSKNVVAVNFF